MLTELIFPT